MGARNLLKSAVAACLIVVTAGCVDIPPSAVKVQEKDARFLQQGTTTRDEVLHRLGPPNILNGKLVSVYEWWTAPGIACLFVPGGSCTHTGSNHSRLLVEFDEAGKVRHFAFAEFHYPGLNLKDATGSYFVDGSARELPRPASPLLQPSRSLDSQSFPLGSYLNPYKALAISRDGRYVAVAPATGGIKAWDLSAGTNRTFSSGLDTHGLVFGRMVVADIIDISRDGKILAAGFDDTAVLWDMASGERLHVIKVLAKPTFLAPLELSPDGRTLATGGHDGTLKLWDVASGKEISSFQVGGGTVKSLAFAPKGDLLAAATSRGDVTVVNLADGKQSTILHGTDALDFSDRRHSPPVGEALFSGRKVAFSPSGNMLAANDCVAVELWRVSEIREQMGPLAAAGRSAGADKQQEPATALLLPYGNSPGCLRRERNYLAFSPDDEVLIASSNLYSVWDLNSRQLLATWNLSHGVDPADLTLGPGAALLAWNEHRGNRATIQIIDLAPIIREAMEGGQRR